jgi:hypothetical protein
VCVNVFHGDTKCFTNQNPLYGGARIFSRDVLETPATAFWIGVGEDSVPDGGSNHELETVLSTCNHGRQSSCQRNSLQNKRIKNSFDTIR